MNGATSDSIVAVVAHARRVPAIERERFAARLRGESTSALVLETCHRVEAYMAGSPADRAAIAVPGGGEWLTGERAVRHAVSVAVGRDSVVVGEDQVLHQLRASVDAARAAAALDPVLERLFAVALHAGRRARSWRQGPPRSLADVAVAAIERQIGPIRGRDVLVVGAGGMGRLATRAAVAAGAAVAVANRSTAAAEALARSIGARAERFDPGARVDMYAGVVVALAGPWPIRTPTLEALARSSTVVVDLSVPAAVSASAAEKLGSRLVTADALALVDAGPAVEDGAFARLDALVEQSTAGFLDWLDGREARSAAEALVDRADREREAELDALWRRLPDLEPETRDAIEGMTRHLANRLLRGPLERLGRDADGHEERTIREIFAL